MTTGIVEFIMKLTDQASGPLDRLVGRADRAGRSLRDAGDTTEKFSKSTGAASERIHTLISRLQRLQNMRGILPPNAEQDITRVNRLISRTNEEIDRMVAGAEGRPTMAGRGRNLGSLFGSLRGSSALAGIARLGPIGLALGGAIQSIRMAIPLENENTVFRNEFGDRGPDLLNQLRRQRASLGSGVMSAGSSLASSGMANHTVIETLRRLGDVANGSETKLAGLSEAMANIHKAGHLTSESFKELERNGFDPLLEMNKRTGESFESLVRRMHQGRINVDEVSESLRRATDAGGEYYGRLAALDETTKTQLALISERFKKAGENFGLNLLESLNIPKQDVSDAPSYADWAALRNKERIQDNSFLGVIKQLVRLDDAFYGAFGRAERAEAFMNRPEAAARAVIMDFINTDSKLVKKDDGSIVRETAADRLRNALDEAAKNEMNDRLNAVSGGGIRNITINIAKGIETVNQYFKEGESGRAANELARRFREELVRTLQSVSAR